MTPPQSTPQMTRYLLSRQIEKASGTQVFYVDAETLDAAEEIMRQGGGEFFSQEVDIEDLGAPEHVGETTLDDYGDGDRPAPQPADPCREALESIRDADVRTDERGNKTYGPHATAAIVALAAERALAQKPAGRAPEQAEYPINFRLALNEPTVPASDRIHSLQAEVERLRELINHIGIDARAQDVLFEWWTAIDDALRSNVAPGGQPSEMSK